jgi:hypothetical protein
MEFPCKAKVKTEYHPLQYLKLDSADVWTIWPTYQHGTVEAVAVEAFSVDGYSQPTQT